MVKDSVLKPPFPWFGGKSRVAGVVWDAFGDVPNYVEPFFGSGAVLLSRPEKHKRKIETINDKDGFVSNFWRAVKLAPEETAEWADWLVSECDLHARHIWLVERKKDLTARLEGDPEYFDAKMAGWWVWGICCWIGSGWCDEHGSGPWHVVDGKLVKGEKRCGIKRELPHLGRRQGIHRKRPHLGDAGQGIHRKRPHLGNAGRGIHRKRPHLGNAGRGIHDLFSALAARLRCVRVCCGDWQRVLGSTPTTKLGLTGVFLDPPYSAKADRDADLYSVDDLDVANKVREWAVEHGDDPLMRIALCGYEGEHEMPGGWKKVKWKAVGGYGSQSNGKGRANASREVIWFSPQCQVQRQGNLFEAVD